MRQVRTSNQEADSVSSSFVQRATSGSGQALPPALRSALEPSFGHNFAHVRVFHDDQAAEGAAALGAKAFTFGQDIVFGAGRYQPDAPEGLRLLTHELTHTIQQGQVPGGGADHYALGRSGDAFERQASETSSAVLGGRGVTAGAMMSSAPAIQCELEEEEVQASMPEPTSSEMPSDLQSYAPEDQGILETPEERRQRVMAADKPLEKDLYTNIIEGLPGGLAGGAVKAGGLGMWEALGGAARVPLLREALPLLWEHAPFRSKNVEKSGDRLLKMAGVNQ